jgi:uncharacterized OB-fold protein
MIPSQRDNYGAPTREIKGDFPVSYHYTAGIAGEKFLFGLKEKKFLATHCSECGYTCFPARMFCEDCFREFDDSDWKELETEGELFSFTEVFFGHDGKKLTKSYFICLVKVSGSNTVFFHKLLNTAETSIGMKVKAIWEENRTGSLLDLKGFTK